MAIGVDMDDVTADIMPALNEFHNQTYGTSFTIDNYKTYYLWDTWGGTPEDTARKLKDFYKTRYFHNLQPILGSVEGTRVIAQKEETYIITSRDLELVDATNAWLARYFPGIFSGVYFATEQDKKPDICKRLGVRLLIEDAPHHAQSCAQQGINVLLYRVWPWNQHMVKTQRIIPVHSWDEIVRYLNQPKV